MAIDDYKRARSQTVGFLDKQGITEHMFYGPTSDQYWSEPNRVVIVNMEPWGYGGRYEVDRNTLLGWLEAGNSKKTHTTKYSYAILSVLLDALESGSAVDRSHLWSAYRDQAELLNTIDRVVYYNLKSESNDRIEQDYDAISDVGATELGRYIWSEITALDPSIILVSGEATSKSVDQLLGSNYSFHYKTHLTHQDGYRIASIKHPSRPSYNDWAEAINKIVQNKTEQATPNGVPVL